jgi:hypothetical protein
VTGPSARCETVESWDQARWARVLDRIEFRDPEVGLRFSGPPLWLEVTMRGPDSATAASGAHGAEAAWDWQSDTTLPPLPPGADDDTLLAAAGRYTLHNLVLNAAHEVGEWLRLDGRRVFPPHGGPVQATGSPWERAGDGAQGNGSVVVEVVDAPPLRLDQPPEGADAVFCVPAEAAAGRWTYLRDTSIRYTSTGVVLDDRRPARASVAPTSTLAWSPEARSEADCSDVPHSGVTGPSDAGRAVLVREVHRAVLHAETAWIVDALHIDGRRPYRLGLHGDPASTPVALVIRYGRIAHQLQRSTP